MACIASIRGAAEVRNEGSKQIHSSPQGLSTCSTDTVEPEIDVHDRGILLKAPCQRLTCSRELQYRQCEAPRQPTGPQHLELR